MIKLHNLVVSYDRHPAVHHLSGTFAPFAHTAIIGPNGAGKTTLLKTLAGLLQPDSGSVDFGDLKRHDIAYLPQQAGIDRNFPISVHDLVLLGHWARIGGFGGTNRALRGKAEVALHAVGLDGFDRRPIGTLSAGQFQRVLFARLLLQDAPVILLDEPFNALDSRTVHDLLHIVDRWHAEKRTVIAVLHDMDQVRKHFGQALFIAREPLGWGPTETVLTAANQLRARRLSEAWSEDAHACERDAA